MEPATVVTIDMLPDDALGVIMSFFDGDSIINAGCACRRWRAKTLQLEEEYKNQTMLLLDFNTILTAEKLSALASHEELDSPENKPFYQFALNRFQNLQEKGLIKQVKPLDAKYKLDMEYLSAIPIGRPTWLETLLFVRHLLPSSESEDYAERKAPQIDDEKFLEWMYLAGSKQVALAVGKAASVRDSRIDDTMIILLKRPLFELSDHIVERLISGSWWTDAAAVLSAVGHPTAILRVLQHEFDPWNKERRDAANIMRDSTRSYLNSVGLKRATELLLSSLDIRCLHLVEVAKDDEVWEEARGGALLLLFLMDNIDDILQCLSVKNRIVKDVVSRILSSLVSKGTSIRQLEAIMRNAEADPHSRIQAAFILKQKNFTVTEADVLAIPTYPMPWEGAVPIPQQLKEAILLSYHREACVGTDLRLLLEACFLEEKSVLKESHKPKAQFACQYPLFGPFSASQIYGIGWGNYDAYKIYCSLDPGTPIDPHVTKYVLATILVSDLGVSAIHRSEGGIRDDDVSYGNLFIESISTLKKNTEGLRLPSWEEAECALQEWARTNGHVVVSEDLLACTFEGLNVYFFGRREPLSVRDLVFYWQD